MKALDFKRFCNENLTDVAWNRIILKNYYLFKEKNISYDTILNPSNLLILDAETVSVLNKTLQEIYQIEVEELNYL